MFCVMKYLVNGQAPIPIHCVNSEGFYCLSDSSLIRRGLDFVPRASFTTSIGPSRIFFICEDLVLNSLMRALFNKLFGRYVCAGIFS